MKKLVVSLKHNPQKSMSLRLLGASNKSIKENSDRLNHKHQEIKSCIYMYMVICRRVSHDISRELVMKISINENFDRSNHSIKMGTAQTSKSQ